MDGAKIRIKEASKGTTAVIWVRDAAGLNQDGEEEPETRYAEGWVGLGDSRWQTRSLGSLTAFYFGSEWKSRTMNPKQGIQVEE